MDSKPSEELQPLPPTTASAGPARKAHLSEHLANERTYLAYLRTSISLISFGVTINRFSLYLIQSNKLPPHTVERWSLADVGRLGLGMVIAGLILLVWACVHYTHISNQIERGDFRPSPIMAWIITLAVLLGGGVSLLWLFTQ